MSSCVMNLAPHLTPARSSRKRILARGAPAVALPVLLLAFAMLLLAQVTPAGAATLTVCPSGGQYATIQAAVDAAAVGDTILICAGTYAESVDLAGAGGDITLVGVGTVVIAPATGQAVYANGASVFPGSITLLNLDATSADSIALEFSAGIAGNLVISGSRAAQASTWGLYALGVTGQVLITDTVFDGNGMAGAEIGSERPNTDCATPGGIPTAIRLAGVEASGNDYEGIVVSTRCGNVEIVDTQADGNGSDGFKLSSFDFNSRIIVGNSRADGNGKPPSGSGSGFNVQAYNLTMQDSSAEGNSSDGVTRVSAAPTLLRVQTNSAATRAPVRGVTGIEAAVVGPAGVPLVRTVEISNTTVAGNINHGINVGGVDFVTITNVSAIGNDFDGIRVVARDEFPQGLVGPAAVGEGMTTFIADSLVMSNTVGIELNDAAAFLAGNGETPGLVNAVGASGYVKGSIVCANTDAGLAATGNISHIYDAGFTYWGSYSGPFHAGKNPAGAGNQVVDSGNSDAFGDADGDVVFAPWVDGITATSVPAVGVVGQPQVVSVVFAAGQLAGLGKGPGNPNDGPRFAVATDNGVVTTPFGSGAAVGALVSEGLAVTATLTPAAAGTATVLVTGPCGLVGGLALPVLAPSISVVKSVGATPNRCAPAGQVAVPINTALYYCLTIANTGNVTLTNQLVSDPQLGINQAPFTYTVAPGASVAITHGVLPGLGPIVFTQAVTNVATITATAVLSQIGGIVLEPQVTVAAKSAGSVRVTLSPTGLTPADEPLGNKRLFLPVLGR